MNAALHDVLRGREAVEWHGRIVRISLFLTFTALSAQFAVRLPFTPVPVTLQTLFVALAGMVLGSRDGFYSMAAYVALGAAGIPLFANLSGGPLVLMGPTGGYLAAFPFAAWISGRLVEYFGRRALSFFLAAVISSTTILAAGTAYLALAFPISTHTAIAVGAVPFIGVELFKTVVAVVVTRRL